MSHLDLDNVESITIYNETYQSPQPLLPTYGATKSYVYHLSACLQVPVKPSLNGLGRSNGLD